MVRRVGDVLQLGEWREPGPEVAEAMRRSRQTALRLLLTGAEVPDLIVELMLSDGVRDTDALRRARLSLQRRRMVVLAGQPGTGKSVAAAQLLVESGNGFWISAADFCEIDPWSERVRRIARTSFVVIDDVGLERKPARLEQLLCDRYGRRVQTAITTNLDPKDFRGRYTERLASRMREVGAWVPCATVERPGSKESK